MPQWPILVLSFLAAPAFASSDAYGEFKTTMQGGGSGAILFWVGDKGTRTEVEVQLGEITRRIVALMPAAHPKLAYHLNDADKTYTEVSLERKPGSSRNYVVKVLEKTTINGYPCQHLLVTDAYGNEREIWVNQTLLEPNVAEKLSQDSDDVIATLKKQNLLGLFVKIVQRNKGSPLPLMTMELLKYEKRPAPAGTFELPPGYTQVVPEKLDPTKASEQLDEKVKNMTPEERELFLKTVKVLMPQAATPKN